MNEKSTLRTVLRRVRKNLPRRVRQTATRQINRSLKKYIRRGKKIAVYRAAGSELNLQSFVDAALSRGAQVFEPQTEKNTRRLWFTPWGVPFNRHARKIRIGHTVVVILPLLGIDRTGFRLGQGGGYYDTSLAVCRSGKPRLVGVGFACQIADIVPREAHDRQLDYFVCERGVMVFRRHQKYSETQSA